MRSFFLTAVAVAALIYTATAGAHIPRLNCNSRLPAKAELSCARIDAAHALGAIRWARTARRQLSLFSDSGSVSESASLKRMIAGHEWLYSVMQSRIREAQRRLAAAEYPPHHALWTCISKYEGSPTSVNPSGHYGMLQMHADWGYGTSHHASDDPQLVQEWAAERAYKSSGYSSSFLYGQWFNYDGAAGECLAYA